VVLLTGSAHLDLDLLFTRPDGGYRVHVLRSPAGDGQSASFVLPFSDLELENFVLKIGRFRTRSRRVETPPIAAAKQMGGRLFEAVFTGGIGECLHRSVARAREENTLLRIRLRLSDCPELANLPWELLYDSSDDWFLALSGRTPVVRYVQLPDPPRPLRVSLPYILIVNSSISANIDVLPLLDKVVVTGKPLLIVAEHIEGEAWPPWSSTSCASSSSPSR
jgi:hypothetical protein